MKISNILAASAALFLYACDGAGGDQASGTSSGADGTATSAVSSAPAVDIPYEKFTLDNGLRVIVHEDRKAPIVAVAVLYHVGSKDEKPGKTGFAHLFEHLMYNGSENYDDEYFKPFREVGATAMNGNTWFDRTFYFQNVPTPALDVALFMESDRMGHLLGAVTEERLQEQISVVQNEKRQGDDQPYGRVEYRQLEGLFPEGHPYRWSTIGSMEDLTAASLDDVKEWFREYYGAANAVLVLAGDIDAATARPLVEKYFGDIASGPPLARRTEWVPERRVNARDVMYDRVPQARIYRTWVVPGRVKEDLAKLQLAASVLGSGKNSRLYKALVHEGQLAVSVSVSAQPFELASFFEISVTIRDGVDVAEVEEILDAELEKFLARGPNEEELGRVRTKIAAGLVRGLENVGGNGGKAAALARGELYAGDPLFFRRKIDWMNAASPGDIRQVAQRWIANGYHQITVLPFPDYSAATSGADRSALPQVGEMPELVFPDIQTATLDNGMEVILAERHTIPVVNVALQFDAGYAADAGGKLGAAGYTMSMLDEGTHTRSALEFAAEAERLGAIISTGSSLDTSRVSLSALSANLVASVDLFADIVLNPAFPEAEIERLRPLKLAGIQQEKARPLAIALRNLPPLLYGDDHPYSIPLTGSGTEASVAAITRADLMAFHDRWIRPDNGRLFVVGDTTMAEILPVLNAALGGWPVPEAAKGKKSFAHVALPEAGRVIIFDKPGAQQSMIIAGHLVPASGDAETTLLSITNDILGGNFTARINMNLREDKAWAYGAYSFTLNAAAQRPWILYAPVQTDKTSESIAELLREVREYTGQRPATQAEMDISVQSDLRGLPGQFESAGAVLGSMVGNARFGRPYDYATTLKDRYASLTLDDIHAKAARSFQPDKLVWLIVGDREEIEAGVRALDLGPLEIRDKDGNPIE